MDRGGSNEETLLEQQEKKNISAGFYFDIHTLMKARKKLEKRKRQYLSLVPRMAAVLYSLAKEKPLSEYVPDGKGIAELMSEFSHTEFTKENLTQWLLKKHEKSFNGLIASLDDKIASLTVDMPAPNSMILIKMPASEQQERKQTLTRHILGTVADALNIVLKENASKKISYAGHDKEMEFPRKVSDSEIAIEICTEQMVDRYQKVEKPRAETPIDEDEIRITSQGRMRNYITYAMALLQEKGSHEIVFKAMGRAINKTVTIVELIKRRIVGLHQNTAIGSSSTDITDTSLEEGLLSYQPPLPTHQVKASTDFDYEGGWFT